MKKIYFIITLLTLQLFILCTYCSAIEREPKRVCCKAPSSEDAARLLALTCGCLTFPSAACARGTCGCVDGGAALPIAVCKVNCVENLGCCSHSCAAVGCPCLCIVGSCLEGGYQCANGPYRLWSWILGKEVEDLDVPDCIDECFKE
jgi:hypothetical protein